MKSNFGKWVSVLFFVCLPIFLFGYWLVDENYIINRYGNESWEVLTLRVYLWTVGYGLAIFGSCVIAYFYIPKWNKVIKLFFLSAIISSFFILVQNIRTYWTFGGFDWTDIIIGFGGIPFLITSIHLIRKLIPKQRQVEKYIYVNLILANSLNDEVLNQSYLGEHHLESQKKKHSSKVGGKLMVLVEYDFLKQCYRKIDETTTRSLNMNRIANDNE